MSQENLLMLGLVFMSMFIGMVAVAFAFRQYMRYKELAFLQSERHNLVVLDQFRSHLERELSSMNTKFSASQERWGELNHLVVGGQIEAIQGHRPLAGMTNFLKAHGLTIHDLQPRRDLIFVLTPFHSDFQDEFETILKVGRDLGFSVIRGDEKVSQADIFPQLLKYIMQSGVLVANITGRNPNVFYELGIAHAMDRPVILIAKQNGAIPFDLQSKRIIFYKDNVDLEMLLLQGVAKMMTENSMETGN